MSRACGRLAAIAGGLMLLPAALAAQVPADTMYACYVPISGTVYRIKAPNAPNRCLFNSHYQFQWVNGGEGSGNGNGNGNGGGSPTGTAGGDLGGTYPNPNVVGLQGRTVAPTAPSNGQVLGWNDAQSRWEPRNVASGGGGGVTMLVSPEATNDDWNPSGVLNFIGPWVSVTVNGNQLISVTTQKPLGSVSQAGARDLTLDMCYRPVGGAHVRYGPGHTDMRVAPGTRVVFTLNAAFMLPAGTYDVGMCGFAPNFIHWNNGARGRTTVLIFPAG